MPGSQARQAKGGAANRQSMDRSHTEINLYKTQNMQQSTQQPKGGFSVSQLKSFMSQSQKNFREHNPPNSAITNIVIDNRARDGVMTPQGRRAGKTEGRLPNPSKYAFN